MTKEESLWKMACWPVKQALKRLQWKEEIHPVGFTDCRITTHIATGLNIDLT